MGFEKFENLDSLKEAPGELKNPEVVEDGIVIQKAQIARGERGPSLDGVREKSRTLAGHFEGSDTTYHGKAFDRRGLELLQNKRAEAFKMETAEEAAVLVAGAENMLRGTTFHLEPLTFGEFEVKREDLRKIEIFSEMPVWNPEKKQYETVEFVVTGIIANNKNDNQIKDIKDFDKMAQVFAGNPWISYNGTDGYLGIEVSSSDTDPEGGGDVSPARQFSIYNIK